MPTSDAPPVPVTGVLVVRRSAGARRPVYRRRHDLASPDPGELGAVARLRRIAHAGARFLG